MSDEKTRILNAMERSSDILDTLKAVKGELYAQRVYMFCTLSDLAYVSGLPPQATAAVLDTLVLSWGYDVKKELDLTTVQMLMKDASGYLDAKELRT